MSFPTDPRKNPGIKRSYYPLPVEDPDDWRCIEVHIPNGEEYHELLITALKSLTIWFNYMRDPSHRGKVIADRFAYALGLPELGCDMNCEELTACLQPFFDALTASQDAQTAQLQALIDQSTAALTANAASEIPPVSSGVSDEICGAATGVVEFMHGFNNDLYTKAELSAVDNANEAVARIIAAIPLFNELPFDELFALSNTMFENQVTAYNADYATAKQDMIDDLGCRIQLNAGVFNYDLWAAWLDGLETLIPANAASALFARYSPLRQTWVNQIAAFFNKNASLQSYFNQAATAYAGGLLNPVVGCADCGGWSHTFDLTSDLEDWFIVDVDGLPAGVFVPGTGVVYQDVVFSGADGRGVVIRNDTAVPETASVSAILDFTGGGGFPGWIVAPDGTQLELLGKTDGSNVVGVTTGLAAWGFVYLQILSSFNATPSGNVVLKSITVSSDTGTDPYA